MSDTRGLSNIRENIGEIRGTLKSMQDFLREYREERIRLEQQLEQRLTADIRNAREESRQFDTQMALRFDQAVAQLKALDEQTIKNKADIEDLKGDMEKVDEVKADVSALKELRKRIISYALFIGTAATVIWAFLGPLFGEWIKQFFRGSK